MPQGLVGDQRLGEVAGEPIADRADKQQGVEQFAVRLAEGVREGAAIALQVGLVGPVIELGQEIGRRLVEQGPHLAGVGLGDPFCIPRRCPVRIGVVVVAASDIVTAVRREPEGLARMAGHGHGTAVLAGNTENLRATRRVDRELVGKSRREDGNRRAAFCARHLLRRVKLRGFGRLLPAR